MIELEDIGSSVGALGTPAAVAEAEKWSICTAPPSGSSSGGSSKSTSDAVANNGNKVSLALHGAGRVLNAARVAALTGPRRWAAAIQLAVQASDPWSDRQIHLIPMERAVRHRFNPDTSTWVLDDVLVRMERLPFAAGAMRECFATKKISTMGGSVFHDWKKAQNCVTKRYKKDSVKRAFYFTDTLVQMDAKMLGEEYNRTGPPKKGQRHVWSRTLQVDFIQPSILEFPQREGSPVMSMEQLIEGPYLKYNSNSGFVLADDLLRHTPQAFSHFSFDVTKGQKICVDVQGVGDLYTDPQIHTLDGHGYGEGNLGLRGMALFFRAHECNALCQRLDLPQFSRCPTDVASQGYVSESSTSAQRPSSHTSVRQGRSGRSSGTSVRRRLHEQQRLTRLAAPATGLQQLRGAAAAAPASDQALAHVHLETARLYGEVVLLPELRPQEDPVQAVSGGLFHLQLAATSGCALAAAVLARAHLGVQASAAQLAALIKAATLSGQFVLHPEMAFHYTHVVAAAGVAQAACALGHAYATGTGIAEGVLGAPDVGQAVAWYRKALSLLDARDLGIAAAARLEGEPGVSAANNFTLGTIVQDKSFLQLDGTLVSGNSATASTTVSPATTTPPLATPPATTPPATTPPATTPPVTTTPPATTPPVTTSPTLPVQPSGGGGGTGIVIGVGGLSNLGTLAASAAPGAQSLMSSEIGTYQDRMGAIRQTLKGGLSLWARVFGDSGKIDPSHSASNFGQGGNFAFDQNNEGQELGLDFAITDGATAGLLLSKNEANQHLTDGNNGSARIRGTTSGIYGTWVADSGLYVDASFRNMSFNSRLTAASGQAWINGNANAFNVEAGQSFTIGNDVQLAPQFQYTWDKVDDVKSETASLAGFQSRGATSSRARLGLMVSKSYNGGDQHEMQSALAALLLSGGDGLDPDAAAACQLFNDAAECAMELGKGKLAQNLYERAAEAEALLDSSP
ncbi:MAG: hypothetical protein WDW36_002161 [Sanguina aurantia]